MAQLKVENIEGVKILDLFYQEDERGSFTKIYNGNNFEKWGIDFEIKEIYYSLSRMNVIRGMHFQMPPYQHKKVVHVLSGKVMDVLLDIRKESPTYGKHMIVNLPDDVKKALYIPEGIAHGFKSLTDHTVMEYCVSSVYSGNADTGIKFDTCGIEWGTENFIISERDRTFISFEKFHSPF